MYLVASESSAVESDAFVEDMYPNSGNSSAVGSRREDVSHIKAARPLCIQHATGQAQTEHSLFVVGSGNGAEVESPAPKPVREVEQNKKPRPKTARPRKNRVSPVQEAGSPLEPWATAPLSRLSRLIRSSSGSSSSLGSQTSQQSPKRY